MGNMPIVTVNNYELIKKAFVQDADTIVDRPDFSKFDVHFRGM